MSIGMYLKHRHIHRHFRMNAPIINSNEIQQLFAYRGTLHKNFKNELNIEGTLKKSRLISGGSIKSGLFNHATFKQLKELSHEN